VCTYFRYPGIFMCGVGVGAVAHICPVFGVGVVGVGVVGVAADVVA
jgi:hypothetical protein